MNYYGINDLKKKIVRNVMNYYGNKDLKKTIKYLASLIILIVIFSICFLDRGTNQSSQEESHQKHKTNQAEIPKKKLYQCPMHPQIISDKAGQSCSICKMDLVEIEKEDETEEDHSTHRPSTSINEQRESFKPDVLKNTMGVSKETNVFKKQMDAPENHATIKLNLDKRQMIGVKSVKVEKRFLFKSIRAPGRVAFDPDLYTAKSEYIEALKQWKKVKNSPLEHVRRNTKEMIQSSRIRLQILGLSNFQIKQIKASSRQGEGLLLAQKGTENWIYADIFEMHLDFIKPGLSVEITAPFFGKKKIQGEVIAVDNVINPQNRTAKVRIKIQKDSIKLRPESFVTVNILSPLGQHISIPISAVMDTGKETFVFVDRGDGRFEARMVHIVLKSDSFFGVKHGLSEGERVVVNGNFMMDSESRLKAVINAYSDDADYKH